MARFNKREIAQISKRMRARAAAHLASGRAEEAELAMQSALEAEAILATKRTQGMTYKGGDAEHMKKMRAARVPGKRRKLGT